MGGRLWLKAVLAQAGAAALLALALKSGLLAGTWAGASWLAAFDGALAMALSGALRLPTWWLPIQGGFVPALAWASRLNLPPWAWLAGFALLWLVFRSNPRERVPLYLSNRATWDAVASLLPEDRPCSFVDLGCGLGGGLARLARQRPQARFLGIESAPLPCLWAWLRARQRPNLRVRWGDLWAEDLGRHDLVYAFLSPEPMPGLWRKARAEMRPGALLVSNSFEAPGRTPDRVLAVDDARRTRLLIWRM
jgi:hypothetical protein